MRDTARIAVEGAIGHERNDLDIDQMLRMALTHAVEIIGEAANHISAETRARAPQIRWAEIRGIRNRLIHAYDVVDLDTLWLTISDDLPPLIENLEKLIEVIED